MKIASIIVFCTTALVVYYLHYYNRIHWFTTEKTTASMVGIKESTKKNKEKKDKNSDTHPPSNENFTIEKEWKMTEKLKEISGLTYIGNNRFACVQDEVGTIFIYNTSSEKIEQEIEFAGSNDYEGIAVVGNTAYVATSDGKITEVIDFGNEKQSVNTYQTGLTIKENVEGFCYDAKNNRLLLAVKDADANSRDYKGIYAFDLTHKKFIIEAAYKIDLNNTVFGKGGKKKSNSRISPSGISIHPETGNIYVVDGRKPQLLIMDSISSIKSLIPLQHPAFSQPEGVTFNAQGELFISNEVTKNSGNILKVKLN